MKDNIADIRSRVTRHDLCYDAVPFTYFEGFILGNGDLGAVLWFEEDRMVLSLDKADVWERRADQSLEPGMDYRIALQQARDGSFDPSCRVFDPVRPPDRVWGNKLPIGRVEWPLGQTPTALEGKIVLYEAAFSLELQLEQGALTVWGYLHACENIVELEMEAHGKIPLPTCSVARRLDERSEEIMQIWDYPETEYGGQGTDRYLVQGYSGDEQYAVFVRQCHVASNRARCAVTVVRGAVGDALPARAAAAVEAWQGRDDLFDEHLAWWARFWTRSHLQVPDAALERLWYAEMYKLGCNARADKYPVTIMGVWNPDTRIPPCYGDLHHNLETEMNYWPIFAANRLELAMPLYELLVDQLPRFEENCRTFFGWSGAYLPANMDIYGQGVGFMWFPWNLQVGVGAWLAQHFWLHYCYSGDRDFLRDKAWPFMEAVGRFWLGFLEADEEGVLHVPWSYSPEYDDIVCKGRDSAFDLALVRYLFTTLIKAARDLGLGAEETASYGQVLENLAPLPVDENGIQVYAGVPLERSHRHFSHLMAIHPLGYVNVEGDAGDRDLIERSLAHLRHIGTGHWSGWSFPWAALIACRARRTNMAHSMLRFYTDQVVLPNTLQVSVDWRQTGFYTAEHGFINTLEAGTGAAAAIMEMLLQSWGSKIRVFPCVPDAWPAASFDSLRAEGAFLVNASYRDGAVEWVHITSEVGHDCAVHNPWPQGDVVLRDLGTGAEVLLNGEVLAFATEAGGRYELIGTVAGRRQRPGATFAGLPRWD